MAETIGTAYVQIEPSFEGAVPKIDEKFGGAGKSSGNSFASGFGSVMGTVGKAAAGAAAAGTAAVAGMVKSAVSSFADYEQLVGGVETLFGDTAGFVEEKADAAFKTAGLSANEYMETVTSFSASLLQSVGGDTEKAASMADQAIIDMSDNANKMGSSMESIQNAYQGFAKQNYTMLDNLKLGYGGTKEEMARLLSDAEKISGQKFDLSSYADVVEAIHVIQTEMGITGTTAKEASSTISGALGMTKASWANLMTAMGTGDSNAINKAIDDLVQSATTLGDNIIPVIEKALGGVTQIIQQLGPEIASALPDLINQILPGLLTAGVDIIQSLGEGILSAVPQLMPTLTNVIVQLCQMLIQMAPQLITIGLQVIKSLAQGIGQALPTLIPTIVDVVMQIVDYLIQNIPLLIEAAIQLIQGLADGLIQAIPVLIGYIPQIITSLVDALVTGVPMLIDGAIQLVMALVNALPQINQALIDALPQIIQAIADALPVLVPALIDGAIQLTIALVAALPQIISALINAIPAVVDAIIQAFVILGPALIETFTQAFEMLGPAFEELGVVATQGWNAIQNAFANVAPWFRTRFTEAVNAIKTVFNTVKTYFQTKYNEIVQIFAGIGAKFRSVGSNIVDGIKQGIGGTWDNLKRFVKELVGDLIAFAKKILGISSPSKVFAKEVGQWIPSGIAAGIDRGMGTLNRKIKLMTDEALSGTVTASIDAANSISVIPKSWGNGTEDIRPVIFNNTITVNGAEDPEAWTQTFIRTLKREARMA